MCKLREGNKIAMSQANKSDEAREKRLQKELDAMKKEIDRKKKLMKKVPLPHLRHAG